MRIGIIGASGRVGTRLIEAILASPGLELAAALVSPGSPLIGKPVAGALEYRPAEKTIRSHCDVMIDFSTPAASLADIRIYYIILIMRISGLSEWLQV